MKLSELVAYRDKLRKHDINTFSSMNNQIFDLLQAEIEDPEYLALFTDHRNEIMRSVDKFKSDHLDYDHKLTQRIHEEEKEYLIESEERFDLYYSKENARHKADRTLEIQPDTYEYLRNRIESYTTWDQAGLQICPSHGNLTDELVSLDPLYLIDFNDSLIKPVRDQFNPQYSNRLRSYTFPKFNKDQDMFARLPQGQFGFVLAYNYFDNMSMQYIQKILKQCFDLLKPGGHMIFTFNDCDLPHNINLVEGGFKYYTPGRLVKHYLENTGFTVLKQFRETYGMAWFEVEKPGKLESIKGSQVLATIHSKSDQKPSETVSKWRADNLGYMKGELVYYVNKTYQAVRDVLPSQKFNSKQWKLVEKD